MTGDLKDASKGRHPFAGLVGLGFLAYIAFFFALSCFYIAEIFKGRAHLSGTLLMLVILALLFTAVTTLSCSWYMFQGHMHTTVIPGIQSMWYRIYIVMLFTLMMVAIVFACIETNRKSCAGSPIETYQPFKTPMSNVIGYFDECLKSKDRTTAFVNGTYLDLRCSDLEIMFRSSRDVHCSTRKDVEEHYSPYD
jgi:hypothetical protein